jgi:GTP-binding protein HflX
MLLPILKRMVTTFHRLHNFSLDDLKKTWMEADKSHRTVFISATNKENIDELRSILYEEVRRIHTIRYPYNNFLYPDSNE